MRRLVSIIAAAIVLSQVAPHAQPASPRPNIVLIITDDLGYGDLGSYGSPDLKTPHLDGLARAGVRMTHFYANGPTCTPTRAGLISGRYQQRYELEQPLSHEAGVDRDRGLRATGRSLPQLLKNSGYTTALVGKWHLGYRAEHSPLAHGFESFFGFKSGFVDYYQHTDGGGNSDLFENDKPVKVNGYMTDLITDRAVKLIAEHGPAPFFLEVAYSAPHWPYQVPDQPSTAILNARHLGPADEHTATRADYVKMMERADQGIGRILAALDRARLSANTLVIFSNDNGGEWLSRNAPLFNRKMSVFEGGIRVPAILRWPGRLPRGVTSTQAAITMDLTATILAAAKADVPADARLEGVDLVPLLNARQPAARTLFWRVNMAGLNQRAIREGSWKLIIDGAMRPGVADTDRLMLFDVTTDPGERQDRSANHQAVVRRLRQQLAAWEKDVDSEAKALASLPQ